MVDDIADAEGVVSALLVSVGLIVRRLRQTDVRGDLKLSEMTALSRLERGGPATISDLARAEQMSPQGMAATVTRLEARALVARRSDPNDGRRVLLSVTDLGREALRHKRRAQARLVAKVVADGFTQDELEILGAAVPLIDRLAESI